MSRRYPRNHLDYMLERAAYGPIQAAPAVDLEALAVLATERGLDVSFNGQGRLIASLPHPPYSKELTCAADIERALAWQSMSS